MARIAGGTFRMGSDHHYPEERPARTVSVDPFLLDRQPVTNRDYARFVAETGYVTMAERPLDPRLYPGAPKENLVPGSLVFMRSRGPVDLRDFSNWWTWTPGACWRHPFGADSTVDELPDHPVVHVACEDAEAYAAWSGKRLPTEAEWEWAARGGLAAATYVWGDDPEPAGERLANYWHGEFPWRPALGYGTTSAVGSYPPNGFGLFDMAGNVWEWTADWYTTAGAAGTTSPCCVAHNPRGGHSEASYDPAQPQFRIPRRTVKGGSHLCADVYCMRYRPAARQPQMIDSGMSHIGFRCASG
jgi:formylglycine-generating enzyme required for sulfatase activity